MCGMSNLAGRTALRATADAGAGGRPRAPTSRQLAAGSDSSARKAVPTRSRHISAGLPAGFRTLCHIYAGARLHTGPGAVALAFPVRVAVALTVTLDVTGADPH